MPKLLHNHIAVVTGGGSGIGHAIALGFAGEGAHVAILDINAQTATNAAAEVSGSGGKATAFALDIADRAACREVAAKIASEVGTVSILVNNAGINRRNPFTGDPQGVIQDWQEVMEVNLTGTFNVTHAFLGQLRATKGRIVNIASVQSFRHVPMPNSPAYTAAKHGLLGFTRALAAELGKDGVRVNALGPGLIETAMNARARANNPALLKIVIDRTPLGRTGKPEDLVGPALFLASDMSSYVTGAVVMADGGYLAI